MNVITFLKERGLDVLIAELAIKPTYHPEKPLIILNYCQIDSPKRHPIVQECRGLVLEVAESAYQIVSLPFLRFFNAGECPDLENKFDWTDFVVEEKVDGSLVLLSQYNGEWLITTRGSFAEGEITPGAGKSWKDVILGRLGDLSILPPNYTYLFELCSPYNQVVKRHSYTDLYLLTGFHNKSGHELNNILLDRWASQLGVKRPLRYDFASLKELQASLESHPEPTFEGYVLRDKNGMRLKVKNPQYIALHRLRNNGNICHPKNLLPLVLRGETAEVLTYFPDMAEQVFKMAECLGGAKARMMAVWEQAKLLKSQKDFALYILKHTQLSAILFNARKLGVEPTEIWVQNEALLLDKLKNGEI